MKKYYQLVFREYPMEDEVYNEAGSTDIFESEIDAWKHALVDCATDLDIAYNLMRAANGEITVKELTVNEYKSILGGKKEFKELIKFMDYQEAQDKADDGVVGD